MQIRFVDRKKELEFLHRMYTTPGFQFIIIHGRRRVGKTVLLEEFCSDKRHIYLKAEQIEKKLLLERFYRETTQQLEETEFLFTSDEAYFKYIAKKAASERLVYILDEFQYYNEIDPHILTLLQRMIDKEWKNTQLLLILCGSELRMMEELFGVQNPLHGRRTGQWKVQPFNLAEITEFLPNQTIINLIQIKAIYGGIPAYLARYEPKKDIWQNIEETIVTRGQFLSEEPLYLLRQEFREIQRYWAIIEAIAQNKNRVVYIANHTGIEARTLTKYLNNLLATELIKKIYPIGPKKAKKTDIRYKIADAYVQFWFKFISPLKSHVELGNTEIVLANIKDKWSDYMGEQFEHAVQEIIELSNTKYLLPFLIMEIGAWWEKEEEIDIIGKNKEKLLLVECKWGEKINGQQELRKLRKKVTTLGWHEKNSIWMAIIARGFQNEEKGCITVDKLWQNYTKEVKIDEFLLVLEKMDKL